MIWGKKKQFKSFQDSFKETYSIHFVQSSEGVTAIIKNVKKWNFPNACVSGKFLKCLGIWQISQMPGYL